MSNGIFLDKEGRRIGYPRITANGAIPVEVVATVQTPPPLFAAIVPKTSNYTIVVGDVSGTLFTNRGATGAVTFTLPSDSVVTAGRYYYFLAVANQNLVIATPTADTMLTFNDVAADTLAFQTANQIIGGLALAFFDGFQWVVVNLTANTATVVT